AASACSAMAPNRSSMPACDSFSWTPRYEAGWRSAAASTPAPCTRWPTPTPWSRCWMPPEHEHPPLDQQLLLRPRWLRSRVFRTQPHARGPGLDGRALLDEAGAQPCLALVGVFHRRAGNERRLFDRAEARAPAQGDLLVRGPQQAQPVARARAAGCRSWPQHLPSHLPVDTRAAQEQGHTDAAHTA